MENNSEMTCICQFMSNVHFIVKLKMYLPLEASHLKYQVLDL